VLDLILERNQEEIILTELSSNDEFLPIYELVYDFCIELGFKPSKNETNLYIRQNANNTRFRIKLHPVFAKIQDIEEGQKTSSIYIAHLNDKYRVFDSVNINVVKNQDKEEILSRMYKWLFNKSEDI
jgi:hypothetical protein